MSNRCQIKCVTYGGALGWFLRKHFSFLTSDLYLEWQYFIRRNLFKRYINYFNAESINGNIVLPCLISIETINRCNSDCEFCPASRKHESRPFKKMDEQLFYKVISELSEIGYNGFLNLYVNNEPFIDTRIVDWYLYAKDKLPKAKMLLYTNGTLLTLEKFKKVIPAIDKCIINNYSEKLKLHDNLKEIMQFVEKDKAYWNKDITIQIRYSKEILTNRAGAAPNKKIKRKNNKVCIMPFTDFTIYPDGTVGLCCSDALEKTNYGNIRENSLMQIWTSENYRVLRDKIGRSRAEYPFCDGCDFVDAGIRNNFIKDKLKTVSRRYE